MKNTAEANFLCVLGVVIGRYLFQRGTLFRHSDNIWFVNVLPSDAHKQQIL